MHALFGVAVMRGAGAEGEMGGAAGATSETASAATEATGTDKDLDPRAINMLDLNPGEDVKILESGTPSTEFVEGSYLFIQIAMLALDIPVTSFDSRRSSFSARIADLNEYEVSSDSKRTKNRYVRQAYSDWLLATVWNDKESPWRLSDVADRDGMRLRDVQEAVEWIPSGSPWLDKLKQIQGDQLGIDIALDNAIDACRRRGVDVFDNIDKQAEVIAYAKLKGVPLMSGQSGQRTAQETAAAGDAAANQTE
jgi:capsid protein